MSTDPPSEPKKFSDAEQNRRAADATIQTFPYIVRGTRLAGIAALLTGIGLVFPALEYMGKSNAAKAQGTHLEITSPRSEEPVNMRVKVHGIARGITFVGAEVVDPKGAVTQVEDAFPVSGDGTFTADVTLGGAKAGIGGEYIIRVFGLAALGGPAVGQPTTVTVIRN